MKQKIYQIVAVDKAMGIGKDGKLPWHFKKEILYFKEVTTKTIDPEKQNMLIMGRTTWESIPENFRPLLGRLNVILTSRTEFAITGAKVAHSLEEALALADESIETIFIIGGAMTFTESLDRSDGLYITKIHKVYECDTFFPSIPENFKQEHMSKDSEDGVDFDYYFYERS